MYLHKRMFFFGGGLTLAALVAFQGSPAVGQSSLADQVRAAAAAAGVGSLKSVPVRGPNLNGVVVNDQALLRLGKAFFWDMQAGSDGQACGSCHFHAGADSRVRNQLSPGLRAVPQDTLFGDNNFPGVPPVPEFQPDYTPLPANFPIHLLQVPDENNFNNRAVQRDTNDVVSSMGVFAGNFTTLSAGLETGTPFMDPTFNRDSPSANSINRNVRRVEPRNTPTMINAVFNHSNFWDGRAHNLFNGVSVIGPLDTAAKIWVNSGAAGRAPVQQAASFPDSSLASQAVGPPTSDLEMSFFNRPFPMVGRKLLSLTPLGLQLVDTTDSVLGSLSNGSNPGLNTSYMALIQTAFAAKYWNGANVTTGAGTFSQMEANFTLFWGLAVQRYEQTLVSNDAPIDRFMEGSNFALTQQQLQGLLVFINRGAARNPVAVNSAIAAAQSALGVAIGTGNCVSCHGGPEFTDAAFTNLTDGNTLELIEIEDTPVLSGGFITPGTVKGLLDNGFSNIGVRPANDDLGRGGLEGGFPLSFTRQLLQYPQLLSGVLKKFPCKVGIDCPRKVQVDGAFKVPGLRNAELTGPYFHNGGQARLRQVVEFYDRQSDFGDLNISNLDPNIAFINLEEEDEDPLVAFLVGLTDERVRQEQAPFDHPQILVPDGGTFASERPRMEAPRVGAGGRPAAGLPPLSRFLGLQP
jgi:cytochrome c peroxidase